MANVEQGCLAIGDITGYTKYLAGVELEHSQDVLADLINVLVNQMRGLLHLAKLEGDAVFCFAHEGEADGGTLLSMIESCYFAFARRLQTIDRHTTCECNACRLIPQLNLKFMVHHGKFIIQEMAGSQELMGRDVIVVHRLLKNSVTDQTGLRGYALFTEPTVKMFGLDPAALAMAEHVETYDDVGSITSHVLDLEARWREEQQRREVYVAPDQGYTLVDVEIPAPPPIVWDLLTSPAKRLLWQPDTLRVDEEHGRGSRGVGTTNHCLHGDNSTVVEEVVDWKPFRYYTTHDRMEVGTSHFTTEFMPAGEHTRVVMRMQPEWPADGPPDMQAMFESQVLPHLRQFMDLGAEALIRLATGAEAAAAERAGSLQS